MPHNRFYVFGLIFLIAFIADIRILQAASEPAIVNDIQPRDVILGAVDAPVTVIEYASLTCSHCADFHFETLPQFKKDYIDAGLVRYILREYPTDELGLSGFMLARCGGPERYHAVVDVLFKMFHRQSMPANSTIKDILWSAARQIGLSKGDFDQCFANQVLFEQIIGVRDQAWKQFDVKSTPTFFVNGDKNEGNRSYEDFIGTIEAHLDESQKNN